MPRLSGGPARDLPACPRPGHDDRRIVKDGKYGNPPRQRFRCSHRDDREDFDRFVPQVPRHTTREATCDACDTAVASHLGPVTGRRYDFPVREVAAAFVAVGGGASFQRAALRARAAPGCGPSRPTTAPVRSNGRTSSARSTPPPRRGSSSPTTPPRPETLFGKSGRPRRDRRCRCRS